MKKLLYAIVFLLPVFLFSQQVDIFQQFNGRYDFTALGNTLNLEENGGGGACDILTTSSADLNLGPTETLVSAHLYWAGSGPGDNEVVLNGRRVNAERNFALNFNGLEFFANYAEVTDIVQADGNGTYTIADLNLLADIPPYCNGGTNFGGWSITVIFEDPALTLNQISLFDGLEFVSAANPQLEIILTGIDVATEDLAKIGFLAWEGDAGLAVDETLLINGVLIDNPPLNPGNNAFNGTNSYTGATDLYNMDLDYYDIEDVVTQGDQSIQINLTSGQDFVMVNNIITYVNSELPDATIEIDDLGILCDNNQIDAYYTVYNINSTAPLPAGVPIAFFANGILVGQSNTTTVIPIGGSESGFAALTIPVGFPNNFLLNAIVDDDGTGTGIIYESNENNNGNNQFVSLLDYVLDLGTDYTIAIGNAPCENTTITIGNAPEPNAFYQWYIFNDTTSTYEVIPGETTSTIQIAGPGLYRLNIETIIGCIATDEVLVEFLPAPIPATPDPLTICDDNNDGFAQFSLTDANIQIIDGATGVFVNYYETLVEAQTGDVTTALASPYTNTSNPQTVFARLEITATGCYETVALELFVFETPVIDNPIPNFELCDDDADQIQIFDLTSWNNQISPTPGSYSFLYFETLADANNNTSSIANDTAYNNTSNPQTIYVRLLHPDGCINISEFDLIVNPLPIYTPPTNYELCDYVGPNDETTFFELDTKTTEMTGDNPAYNVEYFISLADAQTGTPAVPLMYPNTGNPQTIWTRIEDIVTGCHVIDSFQLIVLDTPIAFTPSPIRECDSDFDGQAEFDLTEADPEIINGQTDVFVTYYLTIPDAQAGDPATALVSPYTNITSPQRVYARIENTITGCFDVTFLDLIVILAEPLPTYELCDDDIADGITVFDLTVWDFQIADPPTGLTITYHETPESAQAGTPIINPSTAYTNTSNPQTIYVRVLNSDGCVSIGIFDLAVIPLPVFNTNPTTLEACDDNSPDGLSQFDLTLKDDEITGGNPDQVVSYFLTEADADADINELLSPYGNSSNPQIIYVRVEDVNTGCHDTTTLELFVNPRPRAFPAGPLERCDNNADGRALFDLTLADTDIIGSQTGVFVNYYLTLQDAQAGDSTNALVSPYENISNPQNVYIRIEFTDTGCFDLSQLELISTPATDIGSFPTYELCDDPIEDESTEFNLTLYDNIVVPNPSDFIISYHESFAEAASGANPISPANAYNNTSNPQTIYIRTEDADECVQVGDFELVVIQRPQFDVPSPYALCEDNIPDGSTEFDLTVLDDIIIDGNPDFSVEYYFSESAAETAATPLPDIYTNITNPQIIYVRVDDASTGCYGVRPLELRVVAPEAIVPPIFDLCDEVPNDGFGTFDLTLIDPDITGGNPDLIVSYFFTETEAQDDINPITPPTAFVNTIQGYQVIYARVIDIVLPECYTVVPVEIRVNDAPTITDPISDYFLCDNDQDGVEVFDLTSKDAEIINILIGITMTYHNTQADALAGVNAIVTPEAYPSSGEVIWARGLNLVDCATVVPFNLVIGNVPDYTPIPTYRVCDDDVLDGITVFDLNSQNIAITGGDPDLSVTYYGSLSQAEVPEDPLLIPYTNTVNPELIFVRVESNTTGCYGVFEMVLEVVAPPDIFMPDPLEYCDEDNDGFGEFMLTDADLAVTGGIPTGNLEITYHYLLADAQNGVLPLSSPYFNDVPFSQTVYVRLFDNSTGCFSITTLDLVTLDTPQIIAPSALELCDDDLDGIVFFDLTLSEDELLNGLDPGLYDITYYEDINLTIAITNPSSYPNIPPSPQTIYILVEDIGNACVSQTSLELRVNLPPILIAPTQLELCDETAIDGPNDEREPFDLDSTIDEIRGGDVNIDITFYETQLDADAGTNPLDSPYINTINPQTIFIRGEDINTTCLVSQGLTLDLVVNPLPSPIDPEPLEACDTDNDGFAEFTLTDKDVEILGGEPGVTITYHESLLDADMGINPLVIPYTNTTTPSQIIYARAEYTTPATGCYELVSLELLVTPTPTIPVDLEDLVLCDWDQDGVELFDLTQQDAAIYGSQDPSGFSLTYHLSQVDAQTGNDPIANSNSYPNIAAPQTIWVRLLNDATLCVSVGSFDLLLGGPPSFTEVLLFEQCDDELADGFTEFDLNSQNAAIVAGDTNLGVTYYLTQADAEAAIDPLSIPYTNTSNPQLIYVRVADSTTDCFGVFEMELLVRSAPAIFEPSPLVYCDEDNDGFGEFILTDADLEVTGGIPPGNLVVSYHYLEQDAINGVLPLPIPYLNDVPFSQVVYVRLLDQSTGCFSITSLVLEVSESPQIIEPSDLVLCDTNDDGIAIFDLTLSEEELLNGLDPALYTITYYEDAGYTTMITNPEAYSNIPPSPQTIYILVVDISNSCVSETTLELEVFLGPTILAPTPLELCDVTAIDGPDDEREPFDLQSKTDEITGGDVNINVSYYATQADADAGTNSLDSPYINTSNPQTIFIRAEDVNTSCSISQGVTLDLVVNPLPSPLVPLPLESCDVDNDGFASFDLDSKTEEIVGGEPGVSITYYETQLDAEQGIFALVSPYVNIGTPSQVIYVRAEYELPGTECFRVIEMELVVNPTPVIPIDMEAIVLCDPEGDDQEVFDLTQKEDEIYGTQDPSIYTLTYHTDQADAQAGINSIASPEVFTNATNPQTIWVRLLDSTTSCSKVGSFDIRVELGPDVIQPEPLTQCDDLGEANDGIAIFDLTQKDDEITAGAPGAVVTYYETQADAQAGINAIESETAYENTSNPQVVYVGVGDVNTNCYSATVYLTLRVVANPAAEDPDPIILCDENDPGDGVEEFDLTIREAQILDGESWALSYHTSYEAAQGGIDAIVDPTAYVNTTTPEIIYVRTSIDAADPDSCFEIVELELIVDPLPDDSVDISDYIICEIGQDEESIFDLTSKYDEILNGQDPLLYEVLFYETELDADGMLNPIQDPDIYQNETNPQTIYVVIHNIETECFVSTQSFELRVEEGVIVNPPLPYTICDNLGENDGYGEFDMDNTDLALSILGDQTPPDYILTFYGSIANAEGEIDPISGLYENTINPQVVYARVDNASTSCYDITELILKVEQLPQLELEPTYGLCVDAQGNPIPGDEGTSPPVIDTGLAPSEYIFEWSYNGEVILGEIGASITAQAAGTYSVLVTELLTGCSIEGTTEVVVSAPPSEYSAVVLEGAFADVHTIVATAEGPGEYEFQLDDGPFQDNGTFSGVTAGDHTVTIRDKNGCGSVSIEVGVIDYPRFMTPNDDGYHDTWNIIGIAAADPTAKIYIFDRYGKLLKQISPLDEGWDGTYNGNPLPSSDYWFRVEYKENGVPKEFKGHFSLKR